MDPSVTDPSLGDFNQARNNFVTANRNWNSNSYISTYNVLWKQHISGQPDNLVHPVNVPTSLYFSNGYLCLVLYGHYIVTKMADNQHNNVNKTFLAGACHGIKAHRLVKNPVYENAVQVWNNNFHKCVVIHQLVDSSVMTYVVSSEIKTT